MATQTPNVASPITVLLTDDNKVLRKGFRAILERQSDIKVVGEAENGRQAVELTLKLRPKLVLMDISMPVLNGLLATKEIRVLVPETNVIVLSAHGDAEYVEQAIAFGAVGFLVKQTCSQHLPALIREAQKGNTCFSPYLAKKIPAGQINRKVRASRKSVGSVTLPKQEAAPKTKRSSKRFFRFCSGKPAIGWQ